MTTDELQRRMLEELATTSFNSIGELAGRIYRGEDLALCWVTTMKAYFALLDSKQIVETMDKAYVRTISINR